MVSLWFFLAAFIVTTLAAVIVTPRVVHFATKHGIVTKSQPWHSDGSAQKNMPLLGGVALFVAFVLGILIFNDTILSTEVISKKHIIGLVIGGIILVIGGYLDDTYSLPPLKQLLWPFLAIIAVIISGVGITEFTNPFSPEKLIYVDTFKFDLLTFRGIPYRVTLPADLITFVWLGLIMYSTKLQDGLDGLVSGISFLGSIFIFLLSYFVFDDIPLAVLSALFAGALLGFLKYNFYPAKIFLGESGSLLTGFILGVLAIMSDAKVVITLLLFAVPIADAVWTVVRRIYKKQAPWKGDQGHLHHQLIHAGISPRRAVLLLQGITALFGMLVLLWQSSFRYYFFGVAILLFLILLFLFSVVYKKSRKRI